MMGRFAYSMNVSLDLRIEQVPGDNGAGEWLRISEGVTMHRYAIHDVSEASSC
jgi:hypothetical protein